MPFERERKFLPSNDGWKAHILHSHKITQGYLSRDKECTVRIRIMDDTGFLTVKGLSRGEIRREYEYEIPLSEADELIALCHKPLIRKTRHIIEHDGFIWIADQFQEPSGVPVLIEYEYDDKGIFPEFLPEWLGKEVTGDPSYYNSSFS